MSSKESKHFVEISRVFTGNFTGLSFTEHKLGYSRDAATVARELYEALTQFLQVFPEFKSNDFYVAGIGDGGERRVHCSYNCSCVREFVCV